MKTILPALAVIMIIFASGCGGKQKGNGAADSLNGDTAVVAVSDTVAPADLILTSQGVEDITVGMQTSQIPEDLEGVYESVHSESGYESNTYLFLAEGNPLFTAYEFTPGTLDVISAESPRVTVVAPDGTRLRLGDEFSSVLALPGVEAQWENADGEGMWCWTWEGIWFQPDQSHLSEEMSRQLYSDVAPPAQSAFTPEIRIGYIGTGLPW